MADRETPVDRNLRLLEADIEDLPELAAMWRTDRQAFELQPLILEWENELAMIGELDDAYRSGGMTPLQRARHQRLVRRVRELLPIMNQLSLKRPPEEVLYEPGR